MSTGGVRQCGDVLEDPTCSYQWEWRFFNYSFKDHLYYLGKSATSTEFNGGCGVPVDWDEFERTE